MQRRTFLTAAAAAAIGSLPATSAIAASSKKPPAVRIVFDALSGAADFGDPLPMGADRARAIRASGVTAVNWTVSSSTFEDTISQLAYAQALAGSDPSLWLLARRHSDIAAAARNKQVALLLGFQHPQALGEHGERLETFRQLGVRIMQLTYNNRGLFGDGCLEPGNGGLSRAGFALVEHMNAQGIAVDLGHAGMRTTAEAIAKSKTPALITHTGCRALHDHPRNQTDENLRALADRGGVVGIYFMPYLVASPTVPTAGHVVAHLVHALDVAGTDHVGIGTDGAIAGFTISDEARKAMEADMAERKRTGIAAPEEDRLPLVPELNNVEHMRIVESRLQKIGYPAAVVDKVLGGNFHRVLGDIWGSA
ncbi:MAG TPA: membrane dipeptidase [Steroidobacteraceae bacterium]|nr:membrane dipeptidase [Steroidobacteraceae bacterium]